MGSYFRLADGAFICFDVTNIKSFYDIKASVERFRAIKKHAPIILIGCKTDLDKQREVHYEQAKNLADELGLTYLEESAFKKFI